MNGRPQHANSLLWGLVAALCTLVITGLWVGRRSVEPVVGGVRLSALLKDLDGDYPQHGFGPPWQVTLTPRQLRAADLLRSIPEEALPILTQGLHVPPSSPLLDQSQITVIRRSCFGLAALGTNAITALPALTAALQRPETCLYVSTALASIGQRGRGVLISTLYGTNGVIQSACIVALGNYRVDTPEATDALATLGWRDTNGLALMAMKALYLTMEDRERLRGYLEKIAASGSPQKQKAATLYLEQIQNPARHTNDPRSTPGK